MTCDHRDAFRNEAVKFMPDFYERKEMAAEELCGDGPSKTAFYPPRAAKRISSAMPTKAKMTV